MNNFHDNHIGEPSTSGCAKPVHIQRIEQALDLSVFQDQNLNSLSISEEENETFGFDDNNCLGSINDIYRDSDAEVGDGMYLNFDGLDLERSWLHDIMLEEPKEDENYDPADDVNNLMKIRLRQKKIRKRTKPEVLEQNVYYGAGILSNFDKYPEIKKPVQGKPPKKKREDSPTKSSYVSEMFSDLQEEQLDLDLENSLNAHNLMTDEPQVKYEHSVKPNHNKKPKSKKWKDEESKKKWEESMMQKRRKLFSSIVKKEVGKQQRAKINRHKDVLMQTKKLALACQKVARNKALQSARVVKELQWRMKRLSRENLSYWKRSKRADREIRRKMEKEAEEQRKIDFELIEAKRQQRKLNFLITQTELYAHFMSKKLGEASPEEQLRILSQLDEEKNPRLATIDDYDCDKMKAKAIKNAHDAFQYEKARTRQFDITTEMERKGLDTIDGEFSQPSIFKGTLKAYQLRGMNWLANLYDQGISGILADEMGLGKTVQSIAFLSHLAEFQDLWGPFLVICPASTLHNWQQEFAKFVSCFKVVPYWGNPADRKILRQFWHQDGMHTKDAGFHVVITSYQIVISDVKYFNRIKWQYMILDEAQAIKSTSSMRWKTLLGFNCRNRLLLSGTPIQNSMAELWALLHFIMPTLFDSHEEFNEWFSKDIESHAENKTGIDEKHLSRLHMILKPFMLRRIKKDVENELSDKIEIMVYCPLTTRQRLLYMALKQKIHIEDLLHYTVGGGDSHPIDKNFTSNLMNLVMQFRKVCNHPELFERRDAKSPIFLKAQAISIPYLIYDTNVRKEKLMILQKHLLFSKEYISKAITNPTSIFNVCLALNMSTQEIFSIFNGDVLTLWKCGFQLLNLIRSQFLRINYSDNYSKVSTLLGAFMKMSHFILFDSDLDEIILTKNNTAKKVVYKITQHCYHSMPETIEHRNIRCKNNIEEFEVFDGFTKNQDGSANEFPYQERKPQIFMWEKTEMPSFLFSGTPKLTAQLPQLYCYSRRAAYDYKRHLDDWSWKAFNYYWSESTNKEYPPINTQPAKISHSRFPSTPLEIIRPVNGWSNIFIPDKETLVTDSGKLSVLDRLLKRLKEEGHRVLIYSQMTKMIDLLEEYMWHRHHKYMRLDGSSKISERRDMVADFQARNDIFVFLLSTRAGGLGINLTAADTVIFYDSDWNPTVDQQAMDRAHRLGQTKQVTVYRLICKGSIEERILQRAREKSEIQNLVISGGNFKPETLKPKEVVSLLLDDEEIEQKYRQRAEERKHMEDMRELDRKRKYAASLKGNQNFNPVEVKKIKLELNSDGETCLAGESSPRSEVSTDVQASDDLSDILDVETWDNSVGYNLYSPGVNKIKTPARGSSKRGRPRGSRRASALGRFNNSTSTSTTASSIPVPEIPVTDPLTLSFDHTGSASSLNSQIGTSSNTHYSGSPSIRRGPGRPRLKPTGSSHTGSRGTYRPRKPARPLPVPLPSDGSTSSTSYSYFNVHDQPDL